MYKVSIIIATYNAEKTIFKALESIDRQTYKNKELIIIDGHSKDSTVDIIKKSGIPVDILITEPDNGIYDAWNKGIKRSSGDYIAFLGADDFYKDYESLTTIMSKANDCSSDLIFAKNEIIDSQGNILQIYGKPFIQKDIKKRQLVAHPASLHKKQLFDKYGLFNTDYKIVGDYEFLLRVSELTTKEYIDSVIAVCLGDGISRKNRKRVYLEKYKAQIESDKVSRISALFQLIKSMIRLQLESIL